MKRRTYLSSVAGGTALLIGGIGGVSGQEAPEQATGGPVRWSGLTARGRATADDVGVDVACLGRAVLLDGVAAVSDGCQSLELGDVTVEDGTLTVTVAEVRDAPEDAVCTQAVEHIDYVAKVVLSEAVDQVTVVHETTDGSTVESECETPSLGDRGADGSLFDRNRSEGDHAVDWNKSEGDHAVDWNKSEGDRSIDWNKSEGDHAVDWNKSEGDRSIDWNKSKDDHDFDLNRSDEGDRSWGWNRSDEDRSIDWNHSEDDGERSWDRNRTDDGDEDDGGFWSWLGGSGDERGTENNESGWLFG